MERYSDRAIEIINELHKERLEYNSEYLPLIEAANRLVAYEDTGLEPEEIVKMGMAWEDSKRYSGRLELKLKPYLDIGLSPPELNALKLASVGKCVVEIKEFDGIPIDSLRELAQAYKGGRLVVLPAAKVFALEWDVGPNCDLICPVTIDGRGQCHFCDHGKPFVRERQCRQEDIDQIGKSVFLTQEEAEAALVDENSC